MQKLSSPAQGKYTPYAYKMLALFQINLQTACVTHYFTRPSRPTTIQTGIHLITRFAFRFEFSVV